MTHVRRLSRGLLDQRTELESFFISALAQVKKEIAANRHVDIQYLAITYLYMEDITGIKIYLC